MTVREVVIDDHEITDIEGHCVTNPLRTAIDLVRFSATFGAREAQIVRRLGSATGLRIDDAAGIIANRRNLPNKHRALARLAFCRVPAAELPRPQ